MVPMATATVSAVTIVRIKQTDSIYEAQEKLAPSQTCSCGLEDETAEQILQRCPLRQTARTNVWPTAVQLHAKLYSSREELEKTATFILQTGLSV